MLMLIGIYIYIVLRRWAYALYASSGSYDLECRDPIRLDSLKNMICVPVFLVKRVEIVAIFDEVSPSCLIHTHVLIGLIVLIIVFL